MMDRSKLVTMGWLCLTLVLFGCLLVATRNDVTAKPAEMDKGHIMETLTYGETYVRKAKVIKWVDGDTVDLDIDLGYRVHVHERIRLADVDTPERGRPGFDKATEVARKYAPEGSTCLIRTERGKTGKYGRWIGIIYVEGMGRTLNEVLIQAGWPYVR